MKKKRITFEMTEIKHIEVKTLASSLNMSIKDFMDDAINEFINKLKKKRK